MYIRMVRTKSKGKEYIVHRLVESYKTQEGKVRQRVIMNLGTLSVPKNRWKELAVLLEQRITGQITFESCTSDLEEKADELYARHTFAQTKTKAIEESKKNRDLVTVDLNTVQTSESRTLGAELAADAQWKELEIDGVLKSSGLTATQRSIAKALVIGRLINPGSELETYRWFKSRTALNEMTETDISSASKDMFYRVGDRLYENKEKIEIHLYNKETTLFSLERKLYLFDLTNTYMEGSSKDNELARFGKSKEHRYDCPLIAMALMVDEKGFPIYSNIYEGNTSEPQTLKDVISDIKSRDECFIPQRSPIFIMDRGIATAENIKLLQAEGYKYLLIERSPRVKDYENEYNLLKKCLENANADDQIKESGWSKVSDKTDVYVKKVTTGDTTHVLSFSLAREGKEKSIDELKQKRFLEDIYRLKNSVEKGNIVLATKVNERIGKIKAKYASVASCYEVTAVLSEDNVNRAKTIAINELPKKETRNILAGGYVIITNQSGLDANEIWKTYTTLTRVEAAFRDLKSELGMRPIFHGKAERVKAHLFIGLIAYHLLVSIETKLKLKKDNREWGTIKAILSTHQRTTVTLIGEANQIYTVRVSGRPEAEHQKIYSALGVVDRLKKIKSKIDSEH